MNVKHFIFALLLSAFLWNCTQEDAVQITSSDTETFQRAIDPALENELEQLLKEAKQGLNVASEQRSGRRVVLVPAGSRDALQRALRIANGGIVYLRAGEHYESETVTIDKTVTILSAEGAVLISNSTPAVMGGEVPVQPALHILNAPGTYLSGLEIRPEGIAGSTGILVENSPDAKILQNKIVDFQFSVLLEKSDQTVIYYNTIASTPIWQTGEIFVAQGIVNINGNGVRIVGNDISGATLGVWACSNNGKMIGNRLHDNFIGLLLCKVGDNFFRFPNGDLIGSETAGNHWSVTSNNAMDNFDAGYVIIDDANNNLLRGNFASNNARVDYEASGDSQRFGYFTPKSYENTLYVRNNQTVKDCGEDNTIIGGILVDTNAEPCF